jgi:hypothetical protein
MTTTTAEGLGLEGPMPPEGHFRFDALGVPGNAKTRDGYIVEATLWAPEGPQFWPGAAGPMRPSWWPR